VITAALCLAFFAPADLSSGIALYRGRQFVAAEEEFRRLLAKNPKDTAARLHLARTLIELERVPEALAEIERALSGPEDPEVRFQAGRIVRELAERRLAELDRLAPGSAPLHELAGKQFEQKGWLAEALKEYRAAAALDPARPGIHYLIGNILWRSRELDAAELELRAELARTPHHALASLRLGQILMNRDDNAAALAHLERAAVAMRNSVEVRRDLGKAYRNLGRLAEARGEWEAIANLRPEDDQIHYLLGNLYRELGQDQLAKRALQKHRLILERRRALSEKR